MNEPMKKPKRFPVLPVEVPSRGLTFMGPCCIPSEWDVKPLNHTECKHGEGECETCGTTDKRDVIHETIGGRGKIGRLMKR